MPVEKRLKRGWFMDKGEIIKAFTSHWRSILEISFIIFLFYSNLLMGEYNRSGFGNTKGLIWALQDIFTYGNFLIAIVAATIGHYFFDYLRGRWEKTTL